MSDRTRIDGSVSIKNDETVAAVAYSMAKDLWFEEHRKDPKASDEKFVFLVRTCALALSGSGSKDMLTGWYNSSRP